MSSKAKQNCRIPLVEWERQKERVWEGGGDTIHIHYDWKPWNMHHQVDSEFIWIENDMCQADTRFDCSFAATVSASEFPTLAGTVSGFFFLLCWHSLNPLRDDTSRRRVAPRLMESKTESRWKYNKGKAKIK